MEYNLYQFMDQGSVNRGSSAPRRLPPSSYAPSAMPGNVPYQRPEYQSRINRGHHPEAGSRRIVTESRSYVPSYSRSRYPVYSNQNVASRASFYTESSNPMMHPAGSRQIDIQRPRVYDTRPSMEHSNYRSRRYPERRNDLQQVKRQSSHNNTQSSDMTSTSTRNSLVAPTNSNKEGITGGDFKPEEPIYRNPAQVGREMIPVKLPKEISGESGYDFKVLSYNVLADKLLHDNMRLYQGYKESILDWEYRKNNLMKEILEYNADILCLQEVQEDHFHEFYFPILKEKGYGGFFKKRTGAKPDGCATFFKQNEFDCLGHRMLEYKKQGHPIMDRDNVAIIVKLHPKRMSCGSTLFVANTHILFNKNRGDIKLLQLARLLAEIDDMTLDVRHSRQEPSTKDSHHPVILCGDFNSTPFSPIYNFLLNGEIRYKGLSSVHMSGQNSPQKKPVERPHLNNAFISEELEISGLCRKNPVEKRRAKSPDLNNSDCFITAEKIDGRDVILEEPGVLKHLLRLQSCYTHYLKNGEKEVSTCHTEGCLCVDYIMFSQGHEKKIARKVFQDDDILIEIPQRQLYLSGVLSLLGSKDVLDLGRLPNSYLSSDHLALLASFKLFR